MLHCINICSSIIRCIIILFFCRTRLNGKFRGIFILDDIFKIFFMNCINDMDNVLIISAVIRKNGYQIRGLLTYIVLCLTISRTVYVLIIHSLVELPGLRSFTGLIILFIAFRLAWTPEKYNRIKPNPNISAFQMMFIVIATDFSVCLDSVIITAELSTNPLFIAFGIFLSVFTLFTLYHSFSYVLGTPLIQVITSGLITHIAILSIVKDPLMKGPLLLTEYFFKIHINNWINVFALDIAIILMIIGVMRIIQNRT